jgi:N-acetylglucosaminyl-diphospho-decaprenol L-rhamnosyltransferase
MKNATVLTKRHAEKNMNIKTRLLTVSIVIGGNESLIIPCLESIFAGADIPFDIYVTSNLASDEIIQRINQQFPRVKIVTNKSKKGFAENHNRIIKGSFYSDYYLILNDDTLIPNGSIDSLVAFMNESGNERVAALSPKLLNPDGTLQPSTYRFPNLLTIFVGLTGLRSLIPGTRFVWRAVNLLERIFRLKGKTRLWEHSYTTDVDTFRGACVLVRRSAIEDVGLMDEVSLFGGEETEWHYRFKKKGWKVVFYPDVRIIHYGSESIKRQEDLKVRLEDFKGLLNFYRKHRTYLSYLLLRFTVGFTFLFGYIANATIRPKRWNRGKTYISGIFELVIKPDHVFRGKAIY